jgi:UDP-N-acetylmuramyl pentapeptide phosphotransferase/UDP-N-acetylglucosamine-1-phosphate transferase
MLLKIDLFLSLAISFTIAFFIIPRIIKVSHIKKLFDVPNHRSAAKKIVPTLGGIALLVGFIIGIIISSNGYNINELKYMFAGIIVMFVIGLKDDLIGLSARKKFILQLATAIYVVILGHYRITNFHGILGIQEIGYLAGTVFSVIAIVGIINALNLIDGIDGLASGLGLLISLAYGFWFLEAGDNIYALTCFSLFGSLFAFFLYNVFGSTNKIFMGDTGSLILGTIVALLTIHFNEYIPAENGLHGLPAIALAIIIVPVVDTIRIFAIRLSHGKSPFTPDMNHIHHQVLRLTGSHLKASMIIVTVNALLVILSISLADILENNILFFFMLGLGFTLAGIPSLILKHQDKYSTAKLENKSIYAFTLFEKKRKE